MKRRSIHGLALAACAGLALPRALAAYPDRAVRMVVPWPGGGLVDIPARMAAERLQSALGQGFFVDNKPGAGGTIGADAVAKAEADGYTLMVTTSAIAINKAIGQKTAFDFPSAFEPVALLAYAPLILVVRPESGIKSVGELVARAKRDPGKLSYASAGNGSPGHLAGEWFKSIAAIDVVHVAYKGAPPAMIDQVAGRVDFHFANAAVALPQIRAGKIVPLAVASSKRMALLPEVPTMAESGMADFDADQWIGMLAPRGLAEADVNALSATLQQALADAGSREMLERSGMTPAPKGGTPAQFKAVIQRDLERWNRIVGKTGIKAQ